MRTDIYGNKLRPGHCEIHPQVAEEYPCTLCIKEREIQQQLRKQMPNYIMESQAQAAHQAGHALGLPAGTDITTALVPAITALQTERDTLFDALSALADCYVELGDGNELTSSDRTRHRAVYSGARFIIAKGKGGAA